MALIDTSPPFQGEPLPKRKPLEIAEGPQFTILDVDKSLPPEEYLEAVKALIDKEITIDTISTSFVSRLGNNMQLPFRPSALRFDQFPSRVVDVRDMQKDFLFVYNHERIGCLVNAVAPLDRAVTTIYIPVQSNKTL